MRRDRIKYSPSSTRSTTLSTALRIAELEQTNAHLSARVDVLTQQLDWFKRQLFGTKSEKQLFIDPAVQGNLLAALGVATPPSPQIGPTTPGTYTRRKTCDNAVTDSGLRFDATVAHKLGPHSRPCPRRPASASARR